MKAARSVPNHSTTARSVWPTSSSKRAASVPTSLADRLPMTFSKALQLEAMGAILGRVRR